MKKMMISALCLAGFGAVSLSAQVWNANATTAVPNFSPAGVVKTMTFDGGANGKGVRPRPGAPGAGYSFLYIPVTAPNATVFRCIGLRAHDTSATAYVRADFYRQPRAAAGAAVLLGSVVTNNAGFQYRQGAFAAHAISYPASTYYIRLMFNAGVVPPADLTAYDVSLLGYCLAGFPTDTEDQNKPEEGTEQ